MFADFFRRLPHNFATCFRPRYLPYYGLAVALTYIAVTSGFDWWYFLRTRGDVIRSLTLPGAIIGFFVPLILPPALYVAAEMRGDRDLVQKAALIAEACIAAFLISVALKAFTGRLQPEFYTFTSTADISRMFQFGFLRHGVFWGWPSSHAAVAFALGTSVWKLFTASPFTYVALAYALYVGIAVSMSIHWFSDALAGVIVGTVVGLAIGSMYGKD